MLDVEVVSSWKGPELERALKVQWEKVGTCKCQSLKIMSLIKPQDSR